ncbi:DUF1294 domain-containing protein [Sphingomonas sp. So64.6b]|uniref:DUF1294 domain-containing protein n=1 Tax=Sphingomonas sp. So64.6b TaxID=2997354 RepID=UPI0015FFF38D|nr:DUF1294 domain-containing protein [Sphingomonas sp. So64.6b]QNA84143.1 DUF1294 domain-containing protein [Sphingomonas sp. So64.6b]
MLIRAILFVLFVLLMNVAAILAFGADKARAMAGARRIPEAHLLWLAFLGGSPGALWARQLYRHKTRKQPFSSRLEIIAMLQAGVAMGLIVALI